MHYAFEKQKNEGNRKLKDEVISLSNLPCTDTNDDNGDGGDNNNYLLLPSNFGSHQSCVLKHKGSK
jgi:hypothetical protein